MSEGKRERKKQQETKEMMAHQTGGYCPLIASPLAECFIADINSQNIEQAIYYCGGNYTECEIYRREIKRAL